MAQNPVLIIDLPGIGLRAVGGEPVPAVERRRASRPPRLELHDQLIAMLRRMEGTAVQLSLDLTPKE